MTRASDASLQRRLELAHQRITQQTGESANFAINSLAPAVTFALLRRGGKADHIEEFRCD